MEVQTDPQCFPGQNAGDGSMGATTAVGDRNGGDGVHLPWWPQIGWSALVPKKWTSTAKRMQKGEHQPVLWCIVMQSRPYFFGMFPILSWWNADSDGSAPKLSCFASGPVWLLRTGSKESRTTTARAFDPGGVDNANIMGCTLWWTNILPWKITIFNGKIHYKWPFSIAMLVHQRV